MKLDELIEVLKIFKEKFGGNVKILQSVGDDMYDVDRIDLRIYDDDPDGKVLLIG